MGQLLLLEFIQRDFGQYAMLKAIPNKNAGFIILLTSIFILFYLFYYYDQLLYEMVLFGMFFLAQSIIIGIYIIIIFSQLILYFILISVFIFFLFHLLLSYLYNLIIFIFILILLGDSLLPLNRLSIIFAIWWLSREKVCAWRLLLWIIYPSKGNVGR